MRCYYIVVAVVDLGADLGVGLGAMCSLLADVACRACQRASTAITHNT